MISKGWRFLSYNKQIGAWYRVEYCEVRNKVAQRLREPTNIKKSEHSEDNEKEDDDHNIEITEETDQIAVNTDKDNMFPDPEQSTRVKEGAYDADTDEEEGYSVVAASPVVSAQVKNEERVFDACTNGEITPDSVQSSSLVKEDVYNQDTDDEELPNS